MEWEAPAIVLDARPYGEADAIVAVMTEEHGLHRGLARGGTSRAQSTVWQVANFVQVRWIARLSDQLGNFSGEVIHANAAHVMHDPLALAMLTSVCAVAAEALPEREPQPAVFAALLHLIARLPMAGQTMPDLIRWEATMLAGLGFGLDLTSCAITGSTTGLAYVSPRTGRAVTEAAAGVWTARLLRMPAFLAEPFGTTSQATPADWCDGLRLTGPFLARDAFGHRHRPLPRARTMLYDRVATLAQKLEGAQESENQDAG